MFVTFLYVTRINPLYHNIHANNIYHCINSGLLINDIADHLPVFIICPYNFQRHEIIEFINIRRYSGESTDVNNFNNV